MQHQANDPSEPALVARCPHLGLHDDPATSLAYPSTWNSCYRVRPPTPITLAHQSEACLCPGFVNCPVYLRQETGGSLPAELRGSTHPRSMSPKTGRRRVSPMMLVLIFSAFVVGGLMFAVRLGNSQAGPAVPTGQTVTFTFTLAATDTRTSTVDPGWTNPALAIPTRPSRTPTVNLTTSPATPTGTPTLTFTPSRTPTRTPTLTLTPSRTRTQTATATLTRTKTPTPNPNSTATPTLDRTPSSTHTLPPSARVCGNLLDVPFGDEIKFVVHRVEAGDNLNMYADVYQTTTDAILAVNYHLPTPIWKDWIIVIPYNTSDIAGVPAFEPFQAVWAVYTLEELASQLNADPQEMARYNAFDGPCTMFSGWLIVPRQPDVP